MGLSRSPASSRVTSAVMVGTSCLTEERHPGDSAVGLHCYVVGIITYDSETVGLGDNLSHRIHTLYTDTKEDIGVCGSRFFLNRPHSRSGCTTCAGGGGGRIRAVRSRRRPSLSRSRGQ